MYLVSFNNNEKLGKVIFPSEYSQDYVIRYINQHYKQANPVLEWVDDIRRINNVNLYDPLTFENTVYNKFLKELVSEENYSV